MEEKKQSPQMDDLFRRLREADDQIHLPDSLRVENLRYLLDQADEEMASSACGGPSRVVRPHFARWKGWSAAAAVLVLATAVYWGQGQSFQKAAVTNDLAVASEAAVCDEEEEAALDIGAPAAYMASERAGALRRTGFQDLAAAVTQQLERENTYSSPMDRELSEKAAQPELPRVSIGRSLLKQGGGDVALLEDGIIGYYQPANYQKDENTIYLVNSASLKLLSTIPVDSNTGVELYLEGDTLVTVIQESQPAETILYDENAYTQLSQLDEGGELGGQRPASFVNRGATTVVVYDISDAKSPVEQYRLVQDGSYFSSHQEDGVLYLVTSKQTYTTGLDGSTPVCNAVPMVKENSLGAVPLSPAAIQIAPWSAGDQYTVVSAIELADGKRDTQALLGNVKKTYQKDGALYLACQAQEDVTSQTGLTKFTYDGQLHPDGEGQVPLRSDGVLTMEQKDGGLLVAGNSTDYRTNGTTGMLLALDSHLSALGTLSMEDRTTIRSASLEGGTEVLLLSDSTMAVVNSTDLSSLKQEETVPLSNAPQVVLPFGEDRLLTLGKNSEDGVEAGLRLTLLDSGNGRELASLSLPGNASTSMALDAPNLLLAVPEKDMAAMPLIVKERTGSSSPQLIFWGYAVFSVNDKGIAMKDTISHARVLDESEILGQFQSVEQGVVEGNLLYTFSGSKIVATDLRTQENKYQLQLLS